MGRVSKKKSPIKTDFFGKKYVVMTHTSDEQDMYSEPEVSEMLPKLLFSDSH